jgi:hypothetical protein
MICTGHEGSVLALGMLPCGTIVSGSADRTVRIWQRTLLHNEFSIAYVSSSPLLNRYVRASPQMARRSWHKQVANISYNFNGVSTWVHDLREHYKSRCALAHVIRTCTTDMVDFDSYYVNLALVCRFDHISQEQCLLTGSAYSAPASSHERSDLYARLFMEHRYCGIDDIYNCLDDRKKPAGRIMIIGRAGTGKTTLLRYLSNRWGKKVSTWDNRFDAVFYVKLNLMANEGFFIPERDSHEDLIALICLSLDNLPKFPRDDLSWFLRHRNVYALVLLDGFDEVANICYTQPRARSLIDYALGLPNVVLTSRPLTFPPSWTDNSVFVQIFENIGLSEANVRDYIFRYYGEQQSLKRDSLIKNLERNPNLMCLAQIPVNLNAVCGAWEFESSRCRPPLTVTSLYNRMITAVLRYQKSKRCTVLELTDEDLLTEGKESLEILGRLAYEAFEIKQTQTLSAELMNEFFRGHKDQVRIFREEWGFLRQAEVSSSPHIVGLASHYFVHLTYQEYFVALYFVQALVPKTHQETPNQKRERMKAVQILSCKIQERQNEPQYRVIWTFVAGLLGMSPYNQFADYYWDALLPFHDKPVGKTSDPCASGPLGINPVCRTVFAHGGLIREAILVSKEMGNLLPVRVRAAEKRLYYVMRWQIQISGEYLQTLGDNFTDSFCERQWKIEQSRRRTKLLEFELSLMTGQNSNIQSINWPEVLGELPQYSKSGILDETNDIPETVKIEDLMDSDPEARIETIVMLCRFRCANSIPLLLRIFEQDLDMSARAMALVACCLQSGAMNGADFDNWVDVTCRRLLEAGLQDADERIRRNALLMLALQQRRVNSESLKIKLDILRYHREGDNSAWVRFTSAKLLIMLTEDSDSYYEVVRALQSSDIRVSYEAYSFLRDRAVSIDEIEIVEQLVSVLCIDNPVATTEYERICRAAILRRIRPELYVRMRLDLLVAASKGFIESLWLQMGSCEHTSPELQQVQISLFDRLSTFSGVSKILLCLQDDMEIPLATRIFEDLFESDTSFDPLHGCCKLIPVVSLENSLFGPGSCLSEGMCVDVATGDLRTAVDDARCVVNTLAATITTSSTIDNEHLVAIRLYTLANPPIFKLLNDPFYNPDNRDLKSLRNQLPFMKYMLLSFNSIFGELEAFRFRGPAYRGLRVSASDLLMRKYQFWESEYSIGSKITFPTFTSVSVNLETAEKFSDHFVFMFSEVIGLRLKQISAAVEQEILLKPPAVFIIRRAEMNNNGALTVHLDMDDSNILSYL